METSTQREQQSDKPGGRKTSHGLLAIGPVIGARATEETASAAYNGDSVARQQGFEYRAAWPKVSALALAALMSAALWAVIAVLVVWL